MKQVADAPIQLDLSQLSQWLKLKGVPHRISEADDRQIILMDSTQLQEQIQQVLQRYIEEPEFRSSIAEQLERVEPVTARVVTAYLRATPQQAPLIYLSIVLSLAVAYLTSLGEGGGILRALLIVDPFQLDFRMETVSDRFHGLSEMLARGQVWRLFSPDFLHFSLLHIVFNMLMLWSLGGQLEVKKGSVAFLSMALFVSLASNIAQLADTGYFFGGMSGVVYGLIGYCWVWRRVSPDIFMPDVLFRFSIVWLLIGYTPLTEWAGLGRMANSAHLYGLISGLVWGWLTTNLGAKKIP
jgi:rhomboid protease GlpG